MARKTWSYVLFVAAFLNLMLALTPANPLKAFDWVVMLLCIAGGILVRRPMIRKSRNHWPTTHY